MSDYGDYWDGYDCDPYDYRDDYDDGQEDYYDDCNDYGDYNDVYGDYDDYDDGRDDGDVDDAVDQLVEQMMSLTVGKEYRRFGRFKCLECKNSWPSARVFCVYKGKKNGVDVFEPAADSRQQCIQCKTYCLPYRNEALKKGGATDGKPAHLSHLCERCQKGKACQYAT